MNFESEMKYQELSEDNVACLGQSNLYNNCQLVCMTSRVKAFA